MEGDQRFPVRSGKVCAIGGAVVVLGMGDGSALSVVSLAVAFEDGPFVGSPDPSQASSSNGRIRARAMTPRKRGGVLISLQSLRLLSWGGVARPNANTRRGITCHRTQRDGVNDPAGLPAWRPLRLRRFRCQWMAMPRGSTNGKNTRPGEEPRPQSSGRGAIPP